MNNTKKFQELCRIIDATLFNINNDNSTSHTGHTGHNMINIMNFLLNFDGMNKFLDKDFYSHAKNIIDNTDLTQKNVRKNVKDILMYPTFSYSPWISHNLNINMTADFRLELVHGKVYAVCCNTNITKTIFEKVKSINSELMHGLVPNIETSHITIVNSDVVASICNNNQHKFNDFISTYINIQFSTNLTCIKSTISNDWSVFSKCFVITISSKDLDDFLTDFNSAFEKNIKKSFHMTFAIKPRSLF